MIEGKRQRIYDGDADEIQTFLDILNYQRMTDYSVIFHLHMNEFPKKGNVFDAIFGY